MTNANLITNSIFTDTLVYWLKRFHAEIFMNFEKLLNCVAVLVHLIHDALQSSLSLGDINWFLIVRASLANTGKRPCNLQFII